MDEHIQQLKTYIVQQYQIGQAPDAISSQLITAGWQPDMVHQAFLAVQADMLPQQNATGPAIVNERPGFFNRIKVGWVLFKQSLVILRNNPYLLRYLAMTMVFVVVLNAIWFVIIYFGYDTLVNPDGTDTSWMYVLAFLSYVTTYSVINFYAAALAANILDIFRGNRQPYASYVGQARAKFGPIFVYSLISSIVGMILQYVVERIKFVGWLLSYLIGTAWSLGTLFVLPIIMSEDISATRAIKKSFGNFKQTWGETITAKISVNFPIALIQIALIFVFFVSIFAVASTQSMILFIIIIFVFVFSLIALSVVGSFANSLVNVALYYFATFKQVPPGFTADMLNQVFVPRKKRWYHKK